MRGESEWREEKLRDVAVVPEDSHFRRVSPKLHPEIITNNF
jgi:hypothetical protein